MNETTTAAVAVTDNVSEYQIGHTIYRVKTVFNPAFRQSLSDILARLITPDKNRTSRLFDFGISAH